MAFVTFLGAVHTEVGCLSWPGRLS